MKQRAFSLVELLVVIGIIAILISLLMPTLNRARQQARMVQCASNLRQCGVALLQYADANQGWIVPVGPWNPDAGPLDSSGNRVGAYDSLGTNEYVTQTPWLTWPAVVFHIDKIPDARDPTGFVQDPTAYAPDIMRCPEDFGRVVVNLSDTLHGWGGHSYVINKHLVGLQGQVKKYGSPMGYGLNPSRVPLLGEKVITASDYYLEDEDDRMNESEFERLIDLYKHGPKLGANYLFMDLHVDRQEPSTAFGALDPWDITTSNSK